MTEEHRYESFIEALSYGEEIEFVYHQTNCSITNNAEGWHLYDDDKKIFLSTYYDDPLQLAKEVKIGDKTVEEILTELPY
jgi:glutamine cyclotransferase